jgi:hypothetical protein
MNRWQEFIRHSRLYTVPTDTLLLLFNATPTRWFQCALSEPLPQDAEITAIQYDFAYDAFVVRVSSWSFDAIPDGTVYKNHGTLRVTMRFEGEQVAV